ncbi:hypothetical protein FACS1894189_0690 [Planctomycetales bacterium]|nr:hypothetical protein FACS1894189_0690 [Planctomycetales bacterium]
MATPKIEEILGFNTAKGKDSESVTRRFYITADTPETAKNAFEDFAAGLSVPNGLELGSVDLDEEKNGNGVYFGTITFSSPNPKIKNKISNGLFEVYGEKITEGRKTASRERRFRIKESNATQAESTLENYIRGSSPTSGRLHISDITVDEEQDGDGYFTGTVLYNNPDHKGQSDQFTGTVPAYGARWSEQYENGTHTASAAEDVFELRGYSNAYSALQALKASYQNAYVKEISVEEDSGGADKVYIGRIRRTEEAEENENLRSVSFEVSGSQTKMTHSLGTRGAWAANGASPRNYGGLIGVTDDGVEGVDIDTAVSTFSETVYFYPWFLTTNYIAFLARAYGCVNINPFRGFASGEVRFLGASGSYRQGDKQAELTFKFAVSPNAQNIRVGSMTIPFKYGWDYLWVRWADMKYNNVTVKVPIEAYVEQVYQGLNFYSLGIN